LDACRSLGTLDALTAFVSITSSPVEDKTRTPIMNITQAVCITVGALAALTVSTYLLPRKVTVERSATLRGQSAEVIALAASNKGYQKFNPYRNTDADLKIDLFGPETGVGSGFQFEGKEGKGSQTVRAVAESQVDYEIDLGPMGKPRQSLKATQANDGTHVVWTMEADLGMNPIARVFGLFMDRMVGKTFETGLSNLAAVLAST
jgi:Polyketide cyclase / dehydrase and lipid transport